MFIKFRSFDAKLPKKLFNDKMQLAITALGNNQINFIAEILPAIRDCNCNILEIRSSVLPSLLGRICLFKVTGIKLPNLKAH